MEENDYEIVKREINSMLEDGKWKDLEAYCEQLKIAEIIKLSPEFLNYIQDIFTNMIKYRYYLQCGNTFSLLLNWIKQFSKFSEINKIFLFACKYGHRDTIEKLLN